MFIHSRFIIVWSILNHYVNFGLNKCPLISVDFNINTFTYYLYNLLYFNSSVPFHQVFYCIWKFLGINWRFDGGKLSLLAEFEKCIYFVIYLYVFKLVCTRRENFIRIGITVLYLKSCRCQLWIWRSQIFVLLAPLRVAVKLHLRPSTLQLTPPTLQIQYCYSLIIYHCVNLRYILVN